MSFWIQSQMRPRLRVLLLVLAAVPSWRRARGAWLADDAALFFVCYAVSTKK
jgi:hypothetical protein